MTEMHSNEAHLTQATINLANLSDNIAVLQRLAGDRPLLPAIKANAYGHGAAEVARHLLALGYDTFCIGPINEAITLIEDGLDARFIVLSPTLAQNSSYIVEYALQPVVCTIDQIDSLAKEARKKGTTVKVHIKVDTGMGRVGIQPSEFRGFWQYCQKTSHIEVEGICSHFPMADSVDPSFSRGQIEQFASLEEHIEGSARPLFHIANSAALLSLSESRFDAIRPGIAVYGLSPSPAMRSPALTELKPVLSLTSRITYVKEVAKGTGISYGHLYHSDRPMCIATIPIGYGDGLSRMLSNRLEVLVGGQRCRQVGLICMDQCMIDISALRGRVCLGDEVVIIGSQGENRITVDELAERQGTTSYEIVTALSERISRVFVDEKDAEEKRARFP